MWMASIVYIVEVSKYVAIIFYSSIVSTYYPEVLRLEFALKLTNICVNLLSFLICNEGGSFTTPQKTIITLSFWAIIKDHFIYKYYNSAYKIIKICI